MPRKIGSPYSLNLAGQKFGEWTVTEIKIGNCYLCRCSCGTEKVIQTQTIKRGASKSCGCKGKDWCRKHGMEKTSTYSIWSGVKQRCCNPESGLYKNYGGRGITMHPEWRDDFRAFLKDMGERPGDLTLDRINPNGNYEPKNCRWASRKEQARNKRKTIYLEYRGEKRPMAEWAEMMGIKRKILESRIRSGWDIARALETPNRKKQ